MIHVGRQARVYFCYKPKHDDELTLKVGDIITNIIDVDGGWCEGALNGKRGRFPYNFVEIIPASGEVVAPQPTTTTSLTSASNAGKIISFLHLRNVAFFMHLSIEIPTPPPHTGPR